MSQIAPVDVSIPFKSFDFVISLALISEVIYVNLVLFVGTSDNYYAIILKVTGTYGSTIDMKGCLNIAEIRLIRLVDQG